MLDGAGISITLHVTRFVWELGPLGKSDSVISCALLVVEISAFPVLSRFFRLLFIFSLAVGTDLGRCLRTVLTSKPGKVAKKPFLMAFIQVFMTGLHKDRCRNLTRSTLVQRECTFAAWGSASLLVLSFDLFIGSSHKPVLKFRWASRTTLLRWSMTCVLFCVNQVRYPESQNCPTEYSDLYFRPG